MDHLPDLIQACLQHDRIAQRKLYDRYKKPMYSLAYRMTGDFDTAQDVLQEAFIDMFRHLSDFRGEATFGRWFKTIVIRKAYRHIENRKLWSTEIPEELVSDTGYAGVEAAHLEKALLSLPEGCRTVFLMIEVEGYSHREVAEVLGVTEGTSKSQLHAAKQKLRKLLQSPALLS
ncbi:RNA polymerase sigma factor [Siphonobacter curvatus]|uniref:RNA polymerase subunit sigma-24 n=1 Tax=Siphonobacter curvatus TaxID=2094562 RepID=A0A2S7IME3_9BACT|nr:RNA polymerase sigma factor [Siphonobacter curvatus]PQA58913.1 RNA polymerase subunit sigma-24 [Siphonobacter curvatus]